MIKGYLLESTRSECLERVYEGSRVFSFQGPQITSQVLHPLAYYDLPPVVVLVLRDASAD